MGQIRVNKIDDEETSRRQENIYSADMNSENQKNSPPLSEIPIQNTNSNFHIQFFIKTSSIKLEFQKSPTLPAYHLQVPNPLKPKNNDNFTTLNSNQETKNEPLNSKPHSQN